MNRDILLRRMAEGLKGPVRHLAEAVEWEVYSCHKAMTYLRRLGHVECYGEIPASGPQRGGMPSKLWRISASGVKWVKRRFWWVKTWPVEVLR